MGAEPLHIIYVGLVSEYKGYELMTSSTVGIELGYLFKWRHKSIDGLGGYIALSLPAFRKWCSEAKDLVVTEHKDGLFRFVILYANGDVFQSEYKYKKHHNAIYQGEKYLGNIDVIISRNIDKITNNMVNNISESLK